MDSLQFSLEHGLDYTGKIYANANHTQSRVNQTKQTKQKITSKDEKDLLLVFFSV